MSCAWWGRCARTEGGKLSLLAYGMKRLPKPARVGLCQNVLFDLRDRMLGQILIDLRDDALLDVGVKHMPQLGKGSGRRDHDDFLHIAVTHQLLQRCRHPIGKALLLDLVPVRRLHTAVAMRAGALHGATRAIGALLVCRRIFIAEHPLGLQIGKFLVSGIAEEQRALPVADEYQSVMGNGDFIHVVSPIRVDRIDNSRPEFLILIKAARVIEFTPTLLSFKPNYALIRPFHWTAASWCHVSWGRDARQC